MKFKTLSTAAAALMIAAAGPAFAADNSANAQSGTQSQTELQRQSNNMSSQDITMNGEITKDVVGKTVYGSDGEKLGEVSDVTLANGEAESLVIKRGGIMGLGAEHVQVDPKQASVTEEGVTLQMNKDQLAALPSVEDREDAVKDAKDNQVGRNDDKIGNKDGLNNTTPATGGATTNPMTPQGGNPDTAPNVTR